MLPDYLLKPYPVFAAQRDGTIQPIDADLYGVIYWYHSMKDGECRASNKRLGEVLQVESRTVGNSLTRLEKAGFIKRIYKSASKRNRKRIEPMVTYQKIGERMKPASNADDTSDDDTPSRDTSDDDTSIHQMMTRDTSDDEQNSISRKNKSKREQPKGGEPPEEDQDDDDVTSQMVTVNGERIDAVAETIRLFAENVNPACEDHYRRKPQRRAAHSLIEQHGHELVFKVVRDLLPQTNKVPYITSIHTPYELQKKWVKLRDGVERQRNKQEQKKAESHQEMEGMDVI